jgi:hypothetical protein
VPEQHSGFGWGAQLLKTHFQSKFKSAGNEKWGKSTYQAKKVCPYTPASQLSCRFDTFFQLGLQLAKHWH